MSFQNLLGFHAITTLGKMREWSLRQVESLTVQIKRASLLAN